MLTENMTWIPGGEFQMGSSNFYPEERPVNKTTVDGFWIDKTPVTKREFARFVEATDYKTVAERTLDTEEYSSIDLENFEMLGNMANTPIDPVKVNGFT